MDSINTTSAPPRGELVVRSKAVDSTVSPQPFFLALVVVVDSADQGPEPLSVIVLLNVAELMEDQVGKTSERISLGRSLVTETHAETNREPTDDLRTEC